MKKRNTLILAAFAVLTLRAQGADKIDLILDWFVNPDHAQIIVAQQKGFFEKHDLDVEIIEPSDPHEISQLIAQDKADLGIGHQLYLYLDIDKGLPISRVGTLIASPMNTLFVREDSGIESIADLKGKRIGYYYDDIELPIMLASSNLTLQDVNMVDIGKSQFSPEMALMSGQVDAVIGGFRNWELNAMRIKGVPGRAFYPEEHGIPAYDEEILIANNQERDAPKFARFNAALEEATLYILNHPQEAWKSYSAYKDDLDDPLNRAAWQDTLPRFSLSPGALDVTRYQRFGEFLKAHGLIKTVPELSTYAIQPLDL